jgi:hypothetical protein
MQLRAQPRLGHCGWASKGFKRLLFKISGFFLFGFFSWKALFYFKLFFSLALEIIRSWEGMSVGRVNQLVRRLPSTPVTHQGSGAPAVYLHRVVFHEGGKRSLNGNGRAVGWQQQHVPDTCLTHTSTSIISNTNTAAQHAAVGVSNQQHGHSSRSNTELLKGNTLGWHRALSQTRYGRWAGGPQRPVRNAAVRTASSGPNNKGGAEDGGDGTSGGGTPAPGKREIKEIGKTGKKKASATPAPSIPRWEGSMGMFDLPEEHMPEPEAMPMTPMSRDDKR